MGYYVYVGNALNGDYSDYRHGQIFYRTSYSESTGYGSFKYWDGSWKTTSQFYVQSNGDFRIAGYGSSTYALHRVSDMNCHVYGGGWCAGSRSGSDYTLRYEGRIVNYTGSTIYKRLPGGYSRSYR